MFQLGACAVSFLAGAATLFFVLRNNQGLLNKAFNIDDIAREKAAEIKAAVSDAAEKVKESI